MNLIASWVCLIACSVGASTPKNMTETALGAAYDETAELNALIERPLPFTERAESTASSSSTLEGLQSLLATGMLSVCVMAEAISEITAVKDQVVGDCWTEGKATCELAAQAYSLPLVTTFLSMLADVIFTTLGIFKSHSAFAKAILSTVCISKVMLSLAVAIMFFVSAGINSNTYDLLVKLWTWIIGFSLLNSVLIATPVIEHCLQRAEAPVVSAESA